MRFLIRLGVKRLSCAAGLASLVPASLAQSPIFDPGRSADFQANYSSSAPNLGLPPHVISSEGELSLFADFAHATRNQIPLYVVNRTDISAALVFQPAPQVILTHLDDDGTWVRAQSQVHVVDCISGDTTLLLRPGQHVKIAGYVPLDGARGKVRYQLFNGGNKPIVSNEGIGRWSPADVADASRTEALHSPSFGSGDRLVSTIRNFDSFLDPAQRREALADGIAELDLESRWRPLDVTAVRLRLIQLELASPKLPTGGGLTSTRRRLAEIEQSLPGTPVSPEAFFPSCLEMIRAASPPSGKFGVPETRPWMIWGVIARLPQNEIPAAAWKDAFRLAQARLAVAEVREKDTSGSLFRSERWLSETVSTVTLLAHLGSDSRSLSSACLAGLAARGEYNLIAQAGLKADRPLRLRILETFLHEQSPSDGSRRLRHYLDRDAAQKEFWESSVHSMPWETFALLSPATPGYFEPGMSLDFRAQFEEFLEKGSTGPLPVSGTEQLPGLLKYVAHLSARSRPKDLQLLRRAVNLRDNTPPEESETVRDVRKRLVEAAGRELRLDEFFR